MEQKEKRVLSGIVAWICLWMLILPLCRPGLFVSKAAAFRGKNIWTNGAETIFGRNRNWMYKWTDGWQMTFCIAPRNHMGNTITAEARRTNIDDDNIPYIKSREDYEKLAMICSWYDSNGSIHADNATYAAAQAGVWAIMEDGWESGDSLARLVSRHVPGTYEKWEKLKAYVENTEDGGSGSGLPDWCSVSPVSGKAQQMVPDNGVWTASVDISSVPQLASLNWTFEGDSTGWGKSVSDGKMIFTYNGTSQQEMIVSTQLPDQLKGFAKNTTSLNIYIPKGDRSQIQAMISAGPFEAKIYVRLTFEPRTPEGEVPEVKVYRHTEEFDAHYNFEIKKYCAETGRTLKDSVFQIQEAFDGSQVYGKLVSEQMIPKPAIWADFKVCGEAATDQDGSVSHRDEKTYEYSKTYCDGHPEPEYMDVPELSEDEAGDNSAEVAAVEEANEMLHAQWEALVEACEEETDFHGMEPGEGLEMMLKDRDETYEQFITLKYDYTVQEIQARYGYIRHGLHPDDEKIPVVRMESSEAGAGYEIVEREVVINKDAGFRTENGEENDREDEELVSEAEEPSEDPADNLSVKRKNFMAAMDKNRITAYVGKAKENNVVTATSSNVIETDGTGCVVRIAEAAYESARNRYSVYGSDFDDDWTTGGDVSLPEPIDDDVPWIEPAGTADKIGYTFSIYNHRTEGELHINKRDMELWKGESADYSSYGQSQGDATLEGAVYGLYAAEDIPHPDGKTGIIYRKGDLTAIATTNLKGDACFLAYTEESDVSKAAAALQGHPLILGQYYVKELSRSEGYELSVYGADRQISNVHTDKAERDTIGTAKVVTAMTHPVDMHDGSWLEFDVTCQNTTEGFDLLISGYPEGASFYRSNIKETASGERVVTGSHLVDTGEYERALEGEYRLDGEGNYIPLLDDQGNPVWDMDHPVCGVCYVTRRLNYYPDRIPVPQVDPEKWADTGQGDPEYVKAEANSMLKQTGYFLLDSETGQDAPWTILELSGTTNQQLIEEIMEWFSACSFWDSGAVHKVWQEGGQYKAAVFHDYRRLSGTCIYEAASNTVYVRVPIRTAGMGERHTFVSYGKDQLVMTGGCTCIPLVRQISEEIPFLENIEKYLEPVYAPKYQQYREGDYRLDGNGNRIPIYRREFIYEEKQEITSDYELTPLEAVYDPLTKAYTIHVDNVVDWNHTDHPVTETFRASTGQKQITFNGSTMFYSDYLTDFCGAGASAFAKIKDREDTYIRPAYLTYPGQISPMQDGKGTPLEGTGKYPIMLQERVIKQAVKVTKDIAPKPDRESDGESEKAVSKMDNFRFKIYLKSNLNRLYCSEDGQILWTDRWGNTVDVESYKKQAPTIVPDLYTRPEQIPLLETIEVSMEDGDRLRTIETCNYGKFFDAIWTANQDKWDGHGLSYTSYRPIGNEKNHTDDTMENAKVSDCVRQFSIDWYLDEEVEKLVEERGTNMAYGDQLYDEALSRAITKAQDYLKPFFAYDLDQIYGIPWDSEPDGGKDKDMTTLSADLEDQDHCSRVSGYLPYGTYVIAEQQPEYAKLNDLPNRRYQIDVPKELTLPAVYVDYESACRYPEEMSGYYVYDSEMTPEEMTEKYLIRFHEERRSVNVHNCRGDLVIYPYGLDTDRKREEGMEEAISENGEKIDGVAFWGGIATEDNPSGRYYKDQVAAMTGIQTAFDGLYSSVLVPWSMVIPGDEKTDTLPVPSGESSYQGYAYAKFRNLPYGARLRLEKLDSETHENLLHDGAIFRIYAASGDDSLYGTGKVKFYEKDTLISGTREFLEGMGASNITAMARGRTIADVLFQGRMGKEDEKGPGNLYTGLVPKGTPICKEEDQIFMYNTYGTKTGEFQAFSTTGNHLTGEGYEDQNAGYLETPKPLAAGTYVLTEVKAPAGYTRTKPVAVEVYSDKVTYYKEGDRRTNVIATIYERLSEHPSQNRNKPEDYEDLARIYIENAPIKLKIEKRKESSKAVTWKLSGRIDGTFAQIGGREDYEYAFFNGEYQGYGWKKGTLEYLQALKESGEDVMIVYHGTLFAGYGYITRSLRTAPEDHPYVPGARMTLFEGMELTPSGDQEDHTYEGLVITRAIDQTVTGMYVKKGYAGTRTEFLPETEEGERVWTSRNVEREDTDILYYGLDSLDVFKEQMVDGRSTLYGYDRNHELVPIHVLENDKINLGKNNTDFSIFAFRGGTPYLEIVGGDFTQISYSFMDKRFTGDFARLKRDGNGNYTLGEGAVLYHLDLDGNRDSLVDPDTGMAYVLEETQGLGGGRKQRILVWPVKIGRDPYGAVNARDKITTYRIAAANENQNSKISQEYPESGYITGSWKNQAGENSHTSSTVKTNGQGQNFNGEPLLIDNTGSFEKNMEPALDDHGLVRYYRKSEENYHEQTPLYDRNGDLVRIKEQDLLKHYRQAAYAIKDQGTIFHRYGESYILENTWITGDTTPNDPFQCQITDGQADILKRVPKGTYILEEVEAPEGYTKGFPAGITVEETAEIQTAEMIDHTTKIMVGKVHGTSEYTYKIFDMQSKDRSGQWRLLGRKKEGKGVYGQAQLPGVSLSLYRVDESRKTVDEPTASWSTTDRPFYMEGIPAGEYILEETRTPKGLVASEPVRIKVENTGQVQNYMVYNDHTKVEIEKYTLNDSEKVLVNGAEFHLYEALTDSKGQVVMKDGAPQYMETRSVDSWVSSDTDEYVGFITAFEEMYRLYGTEGTSVSWEDHGVNRSAEQVGCTQIGPSAAGGRESHFPTAAQLLFRTEEGKEIRITVYEQFTFEYQFDYHLLPQAGPYGTSYLTEEGIRRIDGLPVGKTFVLVETRVPDGYAQAEPVVIHVEDMVDIQRYGILNQEGTLLIAKTGENGKQQLSGATLALYMAADDGSLVQDDDHLAARWISGSDGVYTELEKINRQIPEGYGPGDLRLHAIKRLPDGVYYLVEIQAPDYYTLMEPVKIVYGQQEKIQVIRGTDSLVKGELEITKTDLEGKPLSGAVFRLSAFRENDLTVPVYTKTYGEEGGVLKITGLPVGEVKEDGEITPYVYSLREVTPPDGYKTSLNVHTFRFQPGSDRGSYQNGETAGKKLNIVNEKTKVVIQKKEFDALGDENGEGAFIEGAQLAVFQVTGKDSDQRYVYDESLPIATWRTMGDHPSKVLEGLTAGQTYVLVEKQAPEGYDYMKPVFFTISTDGRKIIRISNRAASIGVETQDSQGKPEDSESDAVSALTIEGRYGVKVEMSVKDSKGKEVAAWTAGGEGYLLPETSGLKEGELCIVTETTVYSDGSREVTGRMIKPIFWKDGGCRIPDRQVKQVKLELSREDGTLIRSFHPTETESMWRIENHIASSNPEIYIYNRQGRLGDGLDPRQEVFNRITYTNTAGYKADLKLLVKVSAGTEVVDTGGGSEEDGEWVYHLKDIEPMESEAIVFITELGSDCRETRITAKMMLSPAEGEKGKVKTAEIEKAVPILQKNKLTIFHELTGSGQELFEKEESTFQIFLYDKDGEELRGIYPYDGSRTGILRSGDKISLKGNQYITVDPGNFLQDVRYKAVRMEDGKAFTAWNTEGQTGTGACAVFTRKVTDTGERMIFKKGEGYRLKEVTQYGNNIEQISSHIGFTLNEEAAVDTITGFDRHVRVTISKEDTRGERVPGAVLQILDEQGQIAEQWTSGREPHVVMAVLEEGKNYILCEETSPDGYGRSGNIEFTISKEAMMQQVVMVDRPTTVKIRKTDITGKQEVPGAVMQILDSDGKIVESWTSTEIPHEITGKLTAGKEYILHEEYAPKGFAYGEDIRFLIPEDGRPLQVSMKDKPTHVTVRKTDITGEKEIVGAVLRITDQDGIVMDQWTSEETPHDIVGKLEAGKSYILHESYAPTGYAYASDIPFTVSRDGTIDRVVMKDKLTHISVRKTDITGEQEVPGAILQILDGRGQVIEAWISDLGSHEIVGKLEAGKTYTLHEEYAPGGYGYASDITFTVSEDGTIDQVQMKDDVTKLEILKIDKFSGLPLEGARFRLLKENGLLVDEWASTEKAHQINGRLIAGEEYIIQEISAPDGYGILKEKISVSIPRDASLASIVIENRKKPDRWEGTPKIPQKPKEPDKQKEPDTPEKIRIGKVLAVYKTRLSGKGKYTFGGFKRIGSPKTGDERNTSFILVCIPALLSIIGMIGLRKKDKKNSRGSSLTTFLCILIFSLCMPLKSKAEEVIRSGDTKITVTWNPFTENTETPAEPTETYEYDGREYDLKSCQIIPVVTEEKIEEVKDTIVYEAVEQADLVPDQAQIQVTDQDTGQTIQLMLPALGAEFKNWRWIEGFQFPITVQQYDAGQFYLGDLTVTAGEEQPFSEYKKELLDLIDVNPDFYSIDEIRWTSEPWTGEDGLVYRQAMASGRKYVADCSVVYGGKAVIPSVPARAWQAVYAEKEANTQLIAETERIPEVERGETEEPAGFRIELLKRILRITIGLLLLLFFLILTIVLLLKRKKDCKKRTKENKKNINNRQKWE